MKKLLITTALCSLVSTTALAQDQNAPKWGAHIEGEGKWGTERSLGEVGAFIPVWQNDDTLAFVDIRGRLDDQSSSEGNFGVGLRHQINNEWIAGGYIFYDGRETENDNYYHQATIGAEALSEHLELRVNGYLPERGSNVVTGVSSAGAVSGTSFQITTTGEVRERALPGFDVEAGYKIDLPENWNLWAYAGGFHFDADGAENVSGPRGRLEFNYDNVPYIGDGSRFTLGYELQDDDVRGTQGFAIARLRVPLHFTDRAQSSELSALDKRMTTRIIRDIDIVAGNNTPSVTTENASTTLDSGAIVSGFTLIDANDTITTDVASAGANSLVILDGSAGVITTAVAVDVQNGQTIMGGGGTITLTGTNSGAETSFTLPGTAPTISQTNVSNDVFSLSGLANGATIDGITTTGGDISVASTGSTDLIIRNSTFDAAQIGIQAQTGAGDITIDNVTVSNTTSGSGIQAGGNYDNVFISNSDLNNLSSNGIVLIGGGFTYSNVSITNVTVDTIGGNAFQYGNNLTVTNISGDVTATNVTGSDCGVAGSVTVTTSTFEVNGVACN